MLVNNHTISQNFAGTSKKDVKLDLNSFANASDEELYFYAKDMHNEKHKNDKAKFVGACIGVDAASNMILKKNIVKKVGNEIQIIDAPLSAKIGEGLKSVKNFGLGIAAITVLAGVKNVLLNNNQKFKETEQKHPVMTFFAEIGALALGYKGLKSIGIKTGLNTKIAEKFSPLTKTVKTFKNKIDNSKIATFLMNRGAEFSNKINTKAPVLAKTGRFLLSNSLLIMLIAGMIKLNQSDKEVQKEYQKLKFVQDQIKTNY